MSSPFLLLYLAPCFFLAPARPPRLRVSVVSDAAPSHIRDRERAQIRPADRSPRLTAESADPSRGLVRSCHVAGGRRRRRSERPLAACPVISYHHKTAGGDNASPLLPRALIQSSACALDTCRQVDRLSLYFFALSAVMRYPALYASSIGHRPTRICLSFLCHINV